MDEIAQRYGEAPAGYSGRHRTPKESAIRKELKRLNKVKTVADMFAYRCVDPDEHAIFYYDVINWYRHRKLTGSCATCGGTVNR